MNFSMTGQETGDCLIEVTAWAGLTLYFYNIFASDYKCTSTAKSPFKPGSGTPVVIDSPFGQKVMIQNRNSIYGDYHINPISSPAVTTMRTSVYGNHQPLSSPAVLGAKQKPSDTVITYNELEKLYLQETILCYIPQKTYLSLFGPCQSDV